MGRHTRRASRFPGPALKDWALLGIGLGFVAIGFSIRSIRPTAALGTIVFFGACAAVGWSNILRKRRFARLRPLSVEIVGGVALRPLRFKTALLGAGVLAVGLALLPLGLTGPIVVLVCVIVTITAGAFVLGGVVLGKLPVGFLQFDEAGLTIGQRSSSFTIGWDNIRSACPGEFHDNAVLLLSVRDLGALSVQPPEAKNETIARLRSNEAWVGAHVMVMTGTYGIDLPLLVVAVERYVTDPASRAGLSRPRLSAPSGQ